MSHKLQRTGAALLLHRELLGYTQAGVARIVGVSHVTVCRWEREMRHPTEEQWQALEELQPAKGADKAKKLPVRQRHVVTRPEATRKASRRTESKRRATVPDTDAIGAQLLDEVPDTDAIGAQLLDDALAETARALDGGAP